MFKASLKVICESRVWMEIMKHLQVYGKEQERSTRQGTRDLGYSLLSPWDGSSMVTETWSAWVMVPGVLEVIRR